MQAEPRLAAGPSATTALHEPFTVTVIGGGFSGSAVALQLLPRLAYGERLALIERHSRWGRGVAYGTRCGSHWLNVPAGRLGWDPADEAGFVRWLEQEQAGYGPADFVPRMRMGDYLAAQVQAAVERARSRGVRVLRLQTEVLAGDWQPQAQPQAPFHLQLADGQTLRSTQVVLATGHTALSCPRLPGADWEQAGLIADPWRPGALAGLPEDGEVLVLGTGLTAVDMVTSLQDRGHTGRVTLMSRRGLMPQAHRSLEARPAPSVSPLADLGAVRPRPRALVRAWRGWVAGARAEGRDWRDVMASLRACTPTLWERMDDTARRQCLRHLLPWWDTHRHRIAPGIDRRLSAALQAGQVAVAAGRITSLRPAPAGGWWVDWQPRGGGPQQQQHVAAVLNCTGGSTGLASAREPLLAAWRRQGLLSPDPLDLGLATDAHRRPLNAQGEATPGLYYVGPMLKARHWEAIAIPELRGHALAVAEAVSHAVAQQRAAALAGAAEPTQDSAGPMLGLAQAPC